VVACPECGEENPGRARFCWSCGSALAAESAPAQEVRKTVSILFCDVTGSTTIGEQQDPEQLRRVMSRYYEEARAVLERHGGTVEKFIGDAVMAVFGIPVLHEDDAVRAVRAAVDLREAIAVLNEELEHALDVRIEVRIGVNTGEVIAGDPGGGHSFVAGDAVNVAQRLEAAAHPGEILIGEETHRLARDAVLAEAVEPLELKGKRDPVIAYRLVDVTPGAPGHARRLDSPMVGRDHERELLQQAFERVVEDSTCRLVTILGPAGVGKSRLVTEALHDVGDRATVLSGGCLSYGEGITFWPVLEIVKQATGITDEDSPEQGRERIAAALRGEEAAELVADRVAELIGLVGAGAAAEEGFWGLRKLLEALARRSPLVVVFDDANWAEQTLLDLIEYLAGRSHGAPLLLVCMARQELLETRPRWGGEDGHATTIVLEPLSDNESGRLIGNLLGQAALAADVRARIQEAAEGNPLFVEEMLAMLIDDGLLRRDDGHWAATGDLSEVRVPPSIQALLASRLDRLEADERHVVERAAVEGKTFHQGSVRALAEGQARERVGACLHSLVRKELVRHHAASFAGEDAFRFRHVLIREAAYDSIPKQLRAQLHDRFAAWLEEVAGERVGEYEELLGYHLEQAFRYRVELSRVDEWAQAVALRGGSRLAAAGRRALARSDAPAAVNLLRRAAWLLEEGGVPRTDVVIDLGKALHERGDLLEADGVLAGAVAAAEQAGDPVLAERARIEGAVLRMFIEPDFDLDGALALAHRAVEIFEQAGDELGLAKAWWLVADVCWARLRLGEMEEVLERALVHAERAQAPREVSDMLSGLCRAALLGPTPVEEGIRRCRETLSRQKDDLRLQAEVQEVLSVLLAAQGQFEEARELMDRARRINEELGLGLMRGGSMYGAFVELLAGDRYAAETELRGGYEELERIGERSFLSTTAALLARTLFEQGRLDEAEHYASVSAEAALDDDVASQVIWRGARARILATRGEAKEAELLAREAVERAGQTDWLELHADALVDLGRVLETLGRPGEAEEGMQRAISLYEQKGNVVAAERTRSELARLVEA
jgi:class 3 adenylate cyclase/tetratricopeptide (TPR) repeat protein